MASAPLFLKAIQPIGNAVIGSTRGRIDLGGFDLSAPVSESWGMKGEDISRIYRPSAGLLVLCFRTFSAKNRWDFFKVSPVHNYELPKGNLH
jgi:hypothetical protein